MYVKDYIPLLNSFDPSLTDSTNLLEAMIRGQAFNNTRSPRPHILPRFPISLPSTKPPRSLRLSKLPAVGLYQKAPGGLDLTPPWAPGGKGKYSGKSIVVLGGASIVGQGAIQWARLSGFSPIVATASLSNETFLKSIGATHCCWTRRDSRGRDQECSGRCYEYCLGTASRTKKPKSWG